MFHGKGGYDWETVYNMPNWLRKYTHNTIREFYEKEKEEYDKAAGKSKTITNNSPIARPPIPTNTPTYNTKALKK